MVGIRGIVVGLVVLLSLGAQARAENRDGARAPARSTAYAVKILLPNAEPIVAGAVAGPPSTYGSAVPFAYPADGSIVLVESVSARATAGTARALAGSDLRKVVLFGGEITIDAVVARSVTRASHEDAASRYDATQITNLVVLGQAVEPAPDLRVELADWGHATLLQRRQRNGGPYHRGWVTVLDVRLDADHAGLPIGTRILVGYAEAATRAWPALTSPAVRPVARPTEPLAPLLSGPALRPRITRSLGLPAGARRPGTRGPLPLVLASPRVTSRLTAGGYVFPVYGTVGFSDSFGAPRADTVWHHGVDVFAPLGAPILAVADGTVYSVGRNRLGGNRFWLRDLAGNEFYYAHLSAFSPAAVNGSRVRAGDVIGFVGNTGDAQGTPFHLHFEIHPASLLVRGQDGVINPTRYLRGWQHATDVAFPAAGVWAPTVIASGNSPVPGALLLPATDISIANGLDPSALARVLAPASARRDGAVGELGPSRAPAKR